jgi:23S rRNA (guanosine2251-2'-O)-methyltransferase
MRKIVLIAHNLRSCHNVGSLLRTAEGLGIDEVLLTGYTPYPESPGDTRLPHIRQKQQRQIQKTALGAEITQPWRHYEHITEAINELKQRDYVVAALEQTDAALELPRYEPPDPIALIVGREVEGIEPEVLRQCDLALVIPMFGHKESFNVVQAAAMALYHCRFSS